MLKSLHEPIDALASGSHPKGYTEQGFAKAAGIQAANPKIATRIIEECHTWVAIG